jgi:hypothetical protein
MVTGVRMLIDVLEALVDQGGIIARARSISGS